ESSLYVPGSQIDATVIQTAPVRLVESNFSQSLSSMFCQLSDLKQCVYQHASISVRIEVRFLP
ncbi:hypothetical protein, partial [uncultured Gimesia sp.]|uniref:hypothetical protein n=1 Tax=uncultured Gimesia sp. TaxID=1678688 RepID=UPI002628F4BD